MQKIMHILSQTAKNKHEEEVLAAAETESGL